MKYLGIVHDVIQEQRLQVLLIQEVADSHDGCIFHLYSIDVQLTEHASYGPDRRPYSTILLNKKRNININVDIMPGLSTFSYR